MRKLADIGIFESLGASNSMFVMNEDVASDTSDTSDTPDADAISKKLRRALLLAHAFAKKNGQNEEKLMSKVFESFKGRYTPDYSSTPISEATKRDFLPERIRDIYDEPSYLRYLDTDEEHDLNRTALMKIIPWVLDNDYSDLDAEGNEDDQELIDYLKEERQKRLLPLLRAVTIAKKKYLPDGWKSYEENLADIKARIDETRDLYDSTKSWPRKYKIQDYVFGDRDSYNDEGDDEWYED